MRKISFSFLSVDAGAFFKDESHTRKYLIYSITLVSTLKSSFGFNFACALKSCYNLKNVTFMQKASYPYLPYAVDIDSARATTGESLSVTVKQSDKNSRHCIIIHVLDYI